MSDYDSMKEGPEMDALVATLVMGWHWYIPHGAMADLPQHERHIGGWCNPDKSLAASVYVSFAPSRNIEHAWVVMEKHRALEPMLSWSDEQGCWFCNFEKRPSGEQSFGFTAASAICRAALNMTPANPAEEGV